MLGSKTSTYILTSFCNMLVDGQILESNRQSREHNSRVTLSPDVIMHVLRLHRRQALAYIERRYTRADVESDEEDIEALFGFPGGDASPEDDGATGDSTDCNIS